MLGSWMFIVLSPVWGIGIRGTGHAGSARPRWRARSALWASRRNAVQALDLAWEKLSCPFAGMTRIRFKGFPRHPGRFGDRQDRRTLSSLPELPSERL